MTETAGARPLSDAALTAWAVRLRATDPDAAASILALLARCAEAEREPVHLMYGDPPGVTGRCGRGPQQQDNAFDWCAAHLSGDVEKVTCAACLREELAGQFDELISKAGTLETLLDTAEAALARVRELLDFAYGDLVGFHETAVGTPTVAEKALLAKIEAELAIEGTP